MKAEINLSDSPMGAVLENFPGAQRTLFRRHHIGGCSSCGHSPDETLAPVCARNGNLDVKCWRTFSPATSRTRRF